MDTNIIKTELANIRRAAATIEAQLEGTTPTPGPPPGPTPGPGPTPPPGPTPGPAPTPQPAELVLDGTNTMETFTFAAGQPRHEISYEIVEIALDTQDASAIHQFGAAYCTKANGQPDIPRQVFGLYLNNNRNLYLLTGTGQKGAQNKLGQEQVSFAELAGAKVRITYNDGRVQVAVTAASGAELFAAGGTVIDTVKQGVANRPVWAAVGQQRGAADVPFSLLRIRNLRAE